SHLRGQVARHRVDAVGQVLPRSRHALYSRLPAELAFGADLARDARHFRSERSQLIDHLVDGLRRAQELALQRRPVDFERHRLRQIALRHRTDYARGLARGMHEIVDKLIHRVDRVAPETGRIADRSAPSELAFLAHDAGEALELLRHAL